MSQEHPDMKCRSCKYCEPHDRKASCMHGTCRRRAPQALPVYERTTYGGTSTEYQYDGIWPTVELDDDWCGEYRLA